MNSGQNPQTQGWSVLTTISSTSSGSGEVTQYNKINIPPQKSQQTKDHHARPSSANTSLRQACPVVAIWACHLSQSMHMIIQVQCLVTRNNTINNIQEPPSSINYPPSLRNMLRICLCTTTKCLESKLTITIISVAKKNNQISLFLRSAHKIWRWQCQIIWVGKRGKKMSGSHITN